MRVQGGPTLPLKDTFCPSGGLVPHQIWFLTPHKVQLAKIFREGIPDPFLDLLGTSTGPQKAIFEQIKPFWNPRKFQNRVQNAFCRWWPPILSIIWHLGKILVTQGYLMIISGAKRPDSGQLGAQKGMICSQNGLLRAPKRAPKVQK